MIASEARTHRPECDMAVTNGVSQVGSMQWDGTTFWIDDAGQVAVPQRPCICERIERAEQRMLDAARKAVATVSVCKDTSYEMRVQALAVIDALKEKP